MAINTDFGLVFGKGILLTVLLEDDAPLPEPISQSFFAPNAKVLKKHRWVQLQLLQFCRDDVKLKPQQLADLIRSHLNAGRRDTCLSNVLKRPRPRRTRRNSQPGCRDDRLFRTIHCSPFAWQRTQTGLWICQGPDTLLTNKEVPSSCSNPSALHPPDAGELTGTYCHGKGFLVFLLSFGGVMLCLAGFLLYLSSVLPPSDNGPASVHTHTGMALDFSSPQMLIYCVSGFLAFIALGVPFTCNRVYESARQTGGDFHTHYR
ncbi:hypothetical protein [Pseudomonas sp. LP_7_YM]|uniref:hypothetical protein n=1 Tax=Pseudomonas sp. LP_7_YM TaxID=2485137 RepID=UPI0010ED5D5B|nr:hypothetical protein [Pseudomonas sp. LP_7_YM]TDV67622.1 hypothetical protein EC915_103157 [Pseudomonas sp. LP_7_YM]